MTSPTSYRPILKTFSNNKKIPYIPPLLHDDRLITSFREKAGIFNNFFARQCSLINTNSHLTLVLSKETRKLLPTIHFTSEDILKVVKNVDRIKCIAII